MRNYLSGVILEEEKKQPIYIYNQVIIKEETSKTRTFNVNYKKKTF